MPALNIPGLNVDLPRNAALIDTNVLVAQFHTGDSLHEAARLTLEDDDRFWWVVTPPVVVEASGLLMNRTGLAAVVAMLSWLITPGNRVLLFSCVEGPAELGVNIAFHARTMAARKIDFVDAYLMRVATHLTTVCALAPNFMPILTSDNRDFFKGRGTGYQYSLLDLREPGSEAIPIG